jgi:predicted exporter
MNRRNMIVLYALALCVGAITASGAMAGLPRALLNLAKRALP